MTLQFLEKILTPMGGFVCARSPRSRHGLVLGRERKRTMVRPKEFEASNETAEEAHRIEVAKLGHPLAMRNWWSLKSQGHACGTAKHTDGKAAVGARDIGAP